MLFSSASTLLVFALKSEAQDFFKAYPTLFCGVGKVNATFHLTAGLSRWVAEKGRPPACILNLGSAGSSTFEPGQIVNCTRFIQRDMDARSLGCTSYATPFDDTPHILKNGLRLEGYPEGICGTGDSFATEGRQTDWNVVDMEAYALAKVCLFSNTPFICLKYITDGADQNAAQAWQDQLNLAAYNLKTALETLCHDEKALQ